MTYIASSGALNSTPTNKLWLQQPITLNMLSNQPHLRGHNFTLTKPRRTSQVRRIFFSIRRLSVYGGRIYLLTQRTLAVYASIVHQLVHATCLDFCTVYFEWCLHGFNVFRSVCIVSSMFIASIIVLATCQWLLARCCSINLNLNLKTKSCATAEALRNAMCQSKSCWVNKNSLFFKFNQTNHIVYCMGKSGPALGGTEYRLMPSACRLIVRAKLWTLQFRYLVSRAPMRRRSIVVV